MRTDRSSTRVILIILAAAGLTACGSQRPEWVNRPFLMDAGTRKAFVGTSQDLTGEGAARSDALANARQQVIDSLGVWGSREFRRVIRMRTGRGDIAVPHVGSDDLAKLVSEGEVRARAREFHVERSTRAGKPIYKVFVIIQVSGADAKTWLKKATKASIRRAPTKDESEKRELLAALDQMAAPENNEW